MTELECDNDLSCRSHPTFPKGDHNRRLALAIDPDIFAAEAGITAKELRAYELSPPEGRSTR